MRSEPADTVKTFATLRIVGDQLIPEQVTRILKIVPTRAYAKGQSYYGGERTGQLVGKTGVWYFATHRTVASVESPQSAFIWIVAAGDLSVAEVLSGRPFFLQPT